MKHVLPDRLPCGCIPGHYCCEENTRLWNLVNAAYASGNWEAYQTALVAYRAHRLTNEQVSQKQEN